MTEGAANTTTSRSEYCCHCQRISLEMLGSELSLQHKTANLQRTDNMNSPSKRRIAKHDRYDYSSRSTITVKLCLQHQLSGVLSNSIQLVGCCSLSRWPEFGLGDSKYLNFNSLKFRRLSRIYSLSVIYFNKIDFIK